MSGFDRVNKNLEQLPSTLHNFKLSLALLLFEKKPEVLTAFQQCSSMTGTKIYESDVYMHNSTRKGEKK